MNGFNLKVQYNYSHVYSVSHWIRWSSPNKMKILSFVHPHFLPYPQTLVSVNSMQNICNHLFAANKCAKTKGSLWLMLVKVNHSLNPLSEVLVLKGS